MHQKNANFTKHDKHNRRLDKVSLMTRDYKNHESEKLIVIISQNIVFYKYKITKWLSC
jgi:hypothetical protein